MTKTARIVIISLALLPVLTFWQNCGKLEAYSAQEQTSGAGSSTVSSPFFKKVNSQILQTRCVSCHNSASPLGGVDYSSYAKMMATGSVVAGNPSASAFLRSVIDGSMPQGGARLNVDEINLISAWIAAGAKENELPSADAGADLAATTGGALTLKGSAADPDGVIISYAWSQVSGPSTAVFANAGTLSPTTANLLVGTYVFRLTVMDDSGATASDDISVTVAQPVLFSALNSAIFAPKCLSCHSNALASGNYNMASYVLLMKDVVPGNPNGSKLYQRIIDNSMPPGAPLSQMEKDQVRTWIAQGALNN